MRLFSVICVASLLLAGCDGEEPGAGDGDGGDVIVDVDGGAAGDGAVQPASGTAPTRAVAGEVAAGATNPVAVPAGGVGIWRVETTAGEHVAFRLDFPSATTGVVMAVVRWDGAAPVDLGKTDAGAGLRVLAVLDQGGPRTFWVRIEARAGALSGTLKVTRTPFTEGVRCATDCDRLLQLPLPNDARVDGYDISGAIYRYQFGRRDLVMFLREAGRRMIAAGQVPFLPEDLSQWDGLTPGTDVGATRHASHQRGKDVDVSLYGSDGGSAWRSFCTTTSVDGGRACVNGTAKGLDARATARELAGFYEGGIVTMMFLDQELIELVRPAAAPLAKDGVIATSLVPLYSDGTHLQHWPNHDNHVHVRVSEAAKLVIGVEPVEPP